MINLKKFTTLLFISSSICQCAWGQNSEVKNWRGFVFAKLSSYTNESWDNFGQLTRTQLEHSYAINPQFFILNQFRANANSLNSDLSKRTSLDKKDSFETYAGENFIKYKSDSFIVQAGYQEVIWGEAFGFNYADIVSPKDQRATLYTDAADARRPLLLLNAKKFFSTDEFSGSLQFLYSPEPRFSKTLPLEIYTGPLLSGIQFKVLKEETPKIFEHHELGAKVAGTYSGLDFSTFYYSYLARDPRYTLETFTPGTITVKESHNRVHSAGFSFAKTISDFVLRSDVVTTKNYQLNYVSALGQLLSYRTNLINTVISIDTPTYHDYSGVFILARSTLSDIQPMTFRRKQEDYLVGKISRTFSEDRSLDLTYTHELEHNGHSLQSQFTWPVNNSTDLKFGGEFYFGDESSNIYKLKNISSVFISLKNYFQL